MFVVHDSCQQNVLCYLLSAVSEEKGSTGFPTIEAAFAITTSPPSLDREFESHVSQS